MTNLQDTSPTTAPAGRPTATPSTPTPDATGYVRAVHSLKRISSPREWSLRARLIATLATLLAIACVGVGVAAELALRSYLLNQLDLQVIESSRRATTLFELGPPPPLPPGFRGSPFDPFAGPGPVFLHVPGQGIGTVGMLVTSAGTGEAAVVAGSGSVEPLSAAAASVAAKVPADRHPVSVTLDRLGRYRLVARRVGTQVIVSGLPLAALDTTLLSVSIMFSIIAAIALAASVAACVPIIRHQLAPLAAVSARAQEVAGLELDRGEVKLPESIATDASTQTEVGKLGAALNRMLQHIAAAMAARHASETRVRQFVADASHELRTPLAAIRGYSELAQRRRHEVPDDVAHAMSRVQSETRRMTDLVEDMLLLARLDDGRPLESEAVDLTRLTVDVVSDAHAAGPHHQWILALPDEPVVVTGDAARLHQVLANLLANSRTHTPAGTLVTTSLAADGSGGAVLTVADDGPGIPAHLQPVIFERFARGDSSRSRRAGSTGLGLAIAAAVVTAHRGAITVHSVAGATEFTVRLPGPTVT